MLSKQQIKKITESISQVTKRRYCTQCRSEQLVEGGKLVQVNTKVKRWFCKNCLLNRRVRNEERVRRLSGKV